MRSVSKTVVIALALAAVLIISISAVAAAAPGNQDCPNDNVCVYGGEGPADGTGLQRHERANTAMSHQYQLNNQFNSNGNGNAHQHSRAYRYGHGLPTG